MTCGAVEQYPKFENSCYCSLISEGENKDIGTKKIFDERMGENVTNLQKDIKLQNREVW